MGTAYDESNNDDSFFLPPEVFENEDFKKAMNSFMSPDGKAARFIVSHRGPPATPEGIARVDQIRSAAEESLKGTPLDSASVYMAGAASTAKDWKDGSINDLLLAGVAAICLVFIIMLLITRSFVAALVIVGTVVLSLGASFGVSVLVWQYILGIHLHWMVLAMSVIILLAVGSDYNLLLVSRMKEEIGAGINTGIIRAMGGTGKVVTTAGIVVRVHHGLDGGQRPADHRSDRHDHRPGFDVRHVGCARVHDTGDCGDARPLVLVAPAGTAASSERHARVVGVASVGPVLAFGGGTPRERRR